MAKNRTTLIEEKHKLGLRENWKQFSLLVVVNSFVGALIGLERSILPELTAESFETSPNEAVLIFIAFFGLSKAIANYFNGKLSNRIGRKNLLVFGWIIALPIPFIIFFADHWWALIFANVLLGINQGFTWSSTVIMKIDLVGPKNRGLAMGINESAGYLAVGLGAYLSAFFAESIGLRLSPLYLGISITILALLLSWLFIKDTRHHVQSEVHASDEEPLEEVFKQATFKHPSLSSITQAGLVNNLNDGFMWGMFPILLAQYNYSLVQIGAIVAIYPAVWGLGQLVTGKLGDHYSKKKLLFLGMLLQALALFSLPFFTELSALIIISVFLGIGTAMVYPNFLSAISEKSPPLQRAEILGIFRFWRDFGYVAGALLTLLVLQFSSIQGSILIIASLTLISSIIIKFRMKD